MVPYLVGLTVAFLILHTPDQVGGAMALMLFLFPDLV